MTPIRDAVSARRAQIHQDVEAMPLGYFTQVREMGGSSRHLEFVSAPGPYRGRLVGAQVLADSGGAQPHG